MPHAPDEAVQLRRIADLARKALKQSGRNRDGIARLAKRAVGSASSVMLTNALLRDLFDAVAALDKAKEYNHGRKNTDPRHDQPEHPDP